MARNVLCLRCGAQLQSMRPALVEKLVGAFASLDTYFCPGCGHVEQFVVGLGESRGSSPVPPKPDRPCPHCGKPVPLNFDTCWSCGKEV